MNYKRILTAVLTFCTAISASAQDFVYLFPSKEIAETGEDLFFKAYLMDRETMAPPGAGSAPDDPGLAALCLGISETLDYHIVVPDCPCCPSGDGAGKGSVDRRD